MSRGEAIEIGGGFRIPQIISQSSAVLVEVGTTNRTSLSDYEDAITPRTAAILSVHRSNFTIVGYCESPDLRDLANLARRRGIFMVVDNGSGSLVNTSDYGLRHEPTPREALQSGVDVVTFSTDKLLGGPQGGVVAGREPVVFKARTHPLARTFRPDKLNLAALRATLNQYLTRDKTSVPVIGMLAAKPTELHERATRVANRLRSSGIQSDVVEELSTVGGGALPGDTLPTFAVVIHPVGGASICSSPSNGQAASIRSRDKGQCSIRHAYGYAQAG